MADQLYGASPADYFINSSGAPLPFATGTVWTAETGGTQVTALKAEDGTPQTTVIADSLGNFRFLAVDTLPSDLWIDAGGPDRYVVHAALIGTRLDNLEATVAGMQAVPADIATNSSVTTAVAAEATARAAALTAHNADVAAHPAKMTALDWEGTVHFVGQVPVPGGSVESRPMPTLGLDDAGDLIVVI